MADGTPLTPRNQLPTDLLHTSHKQGFCQATLLNHRFLIYTRSLSRSAACIPVCVDMWFIHMTVCVAVLSDNVSLKHGCVCVCVCL